MTVGYIARIYYLASLSGKVEHLFTSKWFYHRDDAHRWAAEWNRSRDVLVTSIQFTSTPDALNSLPEGGA